MPRAKNKVASSKRRRKIIKAVQKVTGVSRGNVFTVAKNAVEKGLVHAYQR
ncbi:MAG: hypothetical protein MZV64_46275 [Ignavibacteriales bacterium]|nr:hypothetical protein [Ignavibacteriales bacterium]